MKKILSKWYVYGFLWILVALVAVDVVLRLKRTYISKPHRHKEETLLGKNLLTGQESYITTFSNGTWSFNPNVTAVIYNHAFNGKDVTMSINSHGFRDDDVPQRKPDGEKRIIMLGDSITAGDWLPHKNTISEITQNLLNTKNWESPQRFEVINAGVGGIGIKEEIDLLINRGLKLEPDLVLLNFYLNDSQTPWGYTNNFKEKTWLRKHSKLVDTIYNVVDLQLWLQKTGKEKFDWIHLQKKIDWRNKREDF